MDVHCPQCDTLFEFDERQMRGAIATLKCSVCQHLFRIETNIALGREDHRRWMVRNTSTGDVMYFSGFDVLHRWIMEGQLDRTDEISRTGAKWVRLEDIGEFTPVFEVVDSIQSLKRGQQDPRERSQTIQQFPSPHAALRSPSRQPAPSWTGAQPARSPQQSKSLHLPPSPHGAALSIAPLADSAPSFSPSVRLPPQQAPAREPQRSRTPQSLASQPVDAFAPTDAIDVPAEYQGRPNQNQPAEYQGAPDVQPVAAPQAATQPAAETWTMHGPAAATASEPELYRVDTTPDTGGSGFNLVKAVVLLFLICVVAIVSFRFAAPDRFKQVFGGEANTVTRDAIAATGQEPGDENPPTASPQQAFELASAGLSAAYDAAFDRRDAEHGDLVMQGVVAAMSPLHGAVDTAADRASKVKRGSSVNGTLKEAQSALDSGDSKRAYDLFYKVLDRDARNARALTGLGWTLIQMGRHESAAVQFKRAMSIDPGHVSAYLGLAKAERNKGNPKGAIRIYDEFLRRFPSARQANIARTQRDKLLKEIGQ